MLSLTGAPSPDHNASDDDAVSPPVPTVSEADTSVSPTGPADNSTVMPLEETQHTTPTSGCLTVADCEQSQEETQQQITPTPGSLQHPTPTPGSLQHPTPTPGSLQHPTLAPDGLQQQITPTPGGLQQITPTPGGLQQITTTPGGLQQPSLTPGCPTVGAERNDGSSTSLVDSEPHTSPATADQPTDTPSCPDHGEVSNQPPVQPPLVTSAPTSDSYTTKTTEASSDDTSTADSDIPTGQTHDIDSTCTKGTESFPHCQNSHFCPSAKKRIETLLKSQ
ncbi:hypothetical protein ACOMHN_031737 [Nucella lapillus]